MYGTCCIEFLIANSGRKNPIPFADLIYVLGSYPHVEIN